MSETKTPTWDKLLASADAKYTPRLDQDDYLKSLTPMEKIAQLLAWLNYQVENGGWRQWVDNGYAVSVDETIDVVNKIGTPSAKIISEILVKLEPHIDQSVSNTGFFGSYWITEEEEPWGDEEEDDWAEPEEYCDGWCIADDSCDAYFEQTNWLSEVESWLSKQI